MFAYLIILFTVLPALELAVLIKVGAHIGAANTISIILLTGIAGAYLARLEGFAVLRSIQHSLNNGVMPTEEMLNGVLILIGGILLLTPGFITDGCGFILLIPWTRQLLKILARRWTKQAMDKGQPFTLGQRPQSSETNWEDADFH